jgi:hypothetical protein
MVWHSKVILLAVRGLMIFYIMFSGTHADLLITVFHKIITTGHQRLQPLFDCLLTILVNGKCGSAILCDISNLTENISIRFYGFSNVAFMS